MKKLLVLFVIYLSIDHIFAQQTLPIPASIKQAYDKSTRNNTGEPGSRYWQNAADYDVKIKFDPLTG